MEFFGTYNDQTNLNAVGQILITNWYVALLNQIDATQGEAFGPRSDLEQINSPHVRVSSRYTKSVLVYQIKLSCFKRGWFFLLGYYQI